jgi:RNA polymerase-binding transcription factor DksA
MPALTTDAHANTSHPQPTEGSAAPRGPSFGLRDHTRDLHALAWDLTLHHMYQAFAQCALTPAHAVNSGRSDALARVRTSAARHAVDDIRAALQRIESGTYGMCQQCGCAITADRMRACPTTRWCAACQE